MRCGQQDVDSATKVALLGKTVVDNLFETEDPVGKVIRIKKVPFTIVGVLESKGQSPTGQDQDDLIIIPISTAKKKVLGGAQANANAVATIMIEAHDSASMKDAETQAQNLLRQRHHLSADQDDDFSVRNLEELLTAQETSAEVMSILLASIASVSLIVGGIGIMNIMLVSVTERTKDRTADGCRRKTKNRLTQFLVEAVTLAVFGGMFGNCSRDWSVCIDFSFRRMDHPYRPERGCHRVLFFRACRYCFWVLSGAEGRTAESNRSPALRMILNENSCQIVG